MEIRYSVRWPRLIIPAILLTLAIAILTVLADPVTDVAIDCRGDSIAGISVAPFAVEGNNETVQGISTSVKSTTTTTGGITKITFDTLQGNVVVNLPDDLRAGDTIFGDGDSRAWGSD